MEKKLKKEKRFFFSNIVRFTVCPILFIYGFLGAQGVHASFIVDEHITRIAVDIICLLISSLAFLYTHYKFGIKKKIISISSLLSPRVIFSIIVFMALILSAYVPVISGNELSQCIFAIIHFVLESIIFGLTSGFFCEFLELLFCDSDIGFVVCVVLKAIFTSILYVMALVVEYNASLFAADVIFIMILELWLAQSSEYPTKFIVDGQERQVAVICRMLLYFPIFYCILFYKSDRLGIAFAGHVWPVLITILVLSIGLYFLPYRVYIGFAYQNDRLKSIYGQDLFKIKPLLFPVKKEYKRSIMVAWDVIVSLLAAITVIIGYYYAVDHLEMDVISIPFISDHGADILGTLISVTFLLTSFLSYFSSRDDKCLWTDTIEYKLISPRLRNFRSLAVYAFTALLADGICFFMGYDILVAVFFGIDVVMLVVLTFSMIDIYFRRGGIIENLENEFFVDELSDQERKLVELRCNTQVFLADRDYKRIIESSCFLIDAHMFYKLIFDSLGFYIQIEKGEYSNDYKQKVCWSMKHYYSDNPRISRMIHIDQSQAYASINMAWEFARGITKINDSVLRFLEDICESIKDLDRNTFITMLSNKSAKMIEVPPIRSIVFEIIKIEMTDKNPDIYLLEHILKEVVEKYITDCDKHLKANVKMKTRNIWLSIDRGLRLDDQKETLDLIKNELEGIVKGMSDFGGNELSRNYFHKSIQNLISELETAITEHKDSIETKR